MPSSELLKKYLNTSKKPTVILGAVERHLLKQTSERDTAILHPSEIVRSDWCLRASWFLLNGQKKPLNPAPLRLASIFAEGHLTHDKWQRWLTEMDAIIGMWLCEEHHEKWWGRRSDNHRDCLFVKYKEVPVWRADLIGGHADGWLDHTMISTMEEDHLLEIKGVGTGTVRAAGGRIAEGGLEKTFSMISGPFPVHVRQAMLYLLLLHEMYRNRELPQKPPEKILFLYECKADQAVKEFVVEYDEEWLEPVVARLSLFDPDSKIPPPCSTGSIECPQCKGF